MKKSLFFMLGLILGIFFCLLLVLLYNFVYFIDVSDTESGSTIYVVLDEGGEKVLLPEILNKEIFIQKLRANKICLTVLEKNGSTNIELDIRHFKQMLELITKEINSLCTISQSSICIQISNDCGSSEDTH